MNKKWQEMYQQKLCSADDCVKLLNDGDGILELGETWTYYMLYTIQAGDLDPLPNTATATGDDRDGDDVTDSDDHSIAVSFSPQIIAKSA